MTAAEADQVRRDGLEPVPQPGARKPWLTGTAG